MAMLLRKPAIETPELMFIPADEALRALSAELLALARQAQISAEMLYRGSPKKIFEKVNRDLSAVRVVSVEAGEAPRNIGSFRIRDIWAEASPVRDRLKRAIESRFVLDDDEATRTISLVKRKS